NLAMLGMGFGFMLSPISIAVLSATPPGQAGLGSSMIGTTSQFGTSLGVAALGTFVTQQFTSNIASQLTQRGVPDPISATIASRVASAGALARQALPGRLPFPPEVLHQAIGQSFVDAI